MPEIYSRAFDEFAARQEVTPRYVRRAACYIEGFVVWLQRDATKRPLVESSAPSRYR